MKIIGLAYDASILLDLNKLPMRVEILVTININLSGSGEFRLLVNWSILAPYFNFIALLSHKIALHFVGRRDIERRRHAV